MLSLGPGFACDMCLEPFGAELKAPCVISCGHVFCESCLHHVARARSICPLCRTPFDKRHTIKLQIDLDDVPAAMDPLPVSLDSDEAARQLQSRMAQLAAVGATEAQTTQLAEECTRFLQTVSKEMYSDLRTSYKMLSYMCHVKRNFVKQGRTINLLQRNFITMTQEVNRLKAAIEALKIEKRNSEVQVLLVTEQNETAQNQLVLLNEELQRLRSEGGEFSSLEGDTRERDDLSLECERLTEKLDNAEAQVVLVTEQNKTAQNQLVLLNEELQRTLASVLAFDGSV